MMFGYHSRYLRIDASTGGAEAVAVPAGVLRRYVGGDPQIVALRVRRAEGVGERRGVDDQLAPLRPQPREAVEFDPHPR